MEKEINIKEIEALINLMDDPDNQIFDDISKQIFKYGVGIIPYLEKAWEGTIDSAVQKRIENIVHNIQFESVKAEFFNWLSKEEGDLLSGWIIISRYQYPELSEEDIKIYLNRIRKDIWLELNDNLTALEQIKVFNHVFYSVYGFKANMGDVDNPDNNYINKVLETKKGNSASLGLLYMLVAQSLDLPLYGISFPEHFILAYTSPENNSVINPDNKDNVLFYINALNKGNAFSHREAEWFLQQFNLEIDPKYFKPCTKYDTMLRLLEKIIVSYEKKQNFHKAKEIKRLIDIIINF